MPKNKKEARTCHNCGLESLIDCEEWALHESSIPDELPCQACTRNPENIGGKFDFWNEDWATAISRGKVTAELEDSDDVKRELCEKLEALRGGEKLARTQ